MKISKVVMKALSLKYKIQPKLKVGIFPESQIIELDGIFRSFTSDDYETYMKHTAYSIRRFGY